MQRGRVGKLKKESKRRKPKPLRSVAESRKSAELESVRKEIDDGAPRKLNETSEMKGVRTDKKSTVS